VKPDRPPLRIVEAQSPEDAAKDIVAAFESIESAPDKVSRVFELLFERLGADRGDPLGKAGRALSAAIDGNAGRPQAAYHNAQHFCEVMLGAHFLCLLRGLGAADVRCVVVGALIHDFRHDGSVNGAEPFRLERIALQEALPYLRGEGVGAADCQRLSAVVLATEVAHGVDFAIRCHAHHADGGPLPAVPDAAPELACLAQDAVAASQAMILCQADVLPSTALTPRYALRMQARLTQEWGSPLDEADKLAFIDQVLRSGLTCEFFLPNLHALRRVIGQGRISAHRA
jgi:hypothetical protein